MIAAIRKNRLREITINIMFKGCGFHKTSCARRTNITLVVQMFRTLEIYSSSENETIGVGAAVGRLLAAGDTILLAGDLGSGKTRLAKGIISAATGTPIDDVVSPTFTLINRFGEDFPINHADLYRIDANSLEDIDLEDVLEEGGALVVEWAEKVQDLFENALEICIMYAECEYDRRIVFRWNEDSSWNRRIRLVCQQFQCASEGCEPSSVEADTACFL